MVWLLETQGMPRDTVLHLAVGTSMATILLTSASSAHAHAARDAVRWGIVKAMTPAHFCAAAVRVRDPDAHRAAVAPGGPGVTRR